jgi:hypothetical protein
MAQQTPEERARARLREQLAGAAQASADTGQHPGHWGLHPVMLPGSMPGDFTPVRPANYAEHEATPQGDLMRYLTELFGINYADLIAEHGRQVQADAEAGA